MPTSPIFSSNFSTDIWDYIKYPYLIFFLIYLIFAIIVIRQIKLMVQTIDGQMSPIIRIIGIIHLVFAIIVFLLAIIIL